MDPAAKPPPTYGDASPVPRPLPPRKTAAKPEPEAPTVPRFKLRGQLSEQADRAPQHAYADISEDDSDDELPEGRFARIAEQARRKMRKGAAFLAFHAQKAKEEATTFGHETFQTKKHLAKRFDEGATLTELIQENYSFERLRAFLQFETIDDIVELGLETPLSPAFWDILIADHKLEFDDLEKFGLHNVEEYAKAGLTSMQLNELGVNLLWLAENGHFARECIQGAKPFGWTFQDYATLGLNYDVLARMQFGANEYKELFGVEGWQMAHYLGLFDAHTHVYTQEGREKLRRINIEITHG